MKYLLVQDYLLDHSLGELAQNHGVYASWDKTGRKFSLNYDQIEAKESDLLAQQCRGLILTAQDDRCFRGQAIEVNGKLSYDSVVVGPTKILSYGFDRFFNEGQGAAAKIDWSDPNLSILEKLDGSCIFVYWHEFNNAWCVATRAVPEADLLMDNGLFTFRTLFEKAVKETCGLDFDEFTKHLDSEFTYCFELTTPYNRIVVQYPDCRVTLLAWRSLETHLEIDPDTCPLVVSKLIPRVKQYKFDSLLELSTWVSSLSPLEYEGVVVRDEKFQRIKVKNASYVVYNRARDSLGTSERNCLELILREKDDDMVPFLPEEIVKNLQKIKIGLGKLLVDYDQIYQSFRAQADEINPGDKKTFALLITAEKNLWTAPLFILHTGKISTMKEYVMGMCKNNIWSDGFLDKLLEMSKIYG